MNKNFNYINQDELVFEGGNADNKKVSPTRPPILKFYLPNVTLSAGDSVLLKCPSVFDQKQFNQELEFNEYFKIKTVN